MKNLMPNTPLSYPIPISLSQFPSVETTKLKVVVVDDVLMMREHVAELLADTGMVGIIGFAADVRSALETIQDGKPNLVILDISIPGTAELRNGIDVLKWIKRTLPNVYVVMLTNLNDPLYRERCLRAGAYAFLDKSSEFEKLPEIIGRVLNLVSGA